tara:strand:- start:353 stop:2011 length:1659 start_codon:yes stop_codon:yes gene_type:complete
MLSVGHSLSNETPSNSPILSVKGSATFTNDSVCRLRRNWSSDFDFTGTWIISFWFMSTDDSQSSVNSIFSSGYVHASDGTGKGMKITYTPDDGDMKLWTHDGSAALGSIQTIKTGIVLNKWYFIQIKHTATSNALEVRVNNQYTSKTAKAIENPGTDDYIYLGSSLTSRSATYRMCNFVFNKYLASVSSLCYFKGGKPTMDAAKSRRFGSVDDNQPVAWWPLDNASLLSDGTIKDVSRNRLNLSVVTGSYASSSTRPEKYLADLGEHNETDYVLKFRGSDNVVFLNTPINFNNTAGWKKGKITSGSDHMIGSWCSFIGTGDSNRAGVLFHEIDSTETYENKIWFDAQTLKVKYYSAIDGGTTFTSDTDINDTSHHSIIVTYTDTGNAVKVYIDNSEVASGTADVGSFYGGTSGGLNTKNPTLGNSQDLDNPITGTMHNFAAFTGNEVSDRNAFHNSGTSPGNLNALSNCKCWIPMNWSDALSQRSNASEYNYTQYLQQTGKKLNDIITVNDQGDTVVTNGYMNATAKGSHSQLNRMNFVTTGNAIVFNNWTE